MKDSLLKTLHEVMMFRTIKYKGCTIEVKGTQYIWNGIDRLSLGGAYQAIDNAKLSLTNSIKRA